MARHRKKRQKRAATPTGLMREMLAAAESAAHDGSLEIALAIAATTDRVTVDTTTTPFEARPDNLFELTFNDEHVGLSNDQMAIFKANLGVLLPALKRDIAAIPENANLLIGDVARLVMLLLLREP
jgi:hypothetical protein